MSRGKRYLLNGSVRGHLLDTHTTKIQKDAAAYRLCKPCDTGKSHGLRVVRAYNAEKYQEDKFATANSNMTQNQLFAQRTMSFMMPSIQLIISSFSLAVYWIGEVLINQAEMLDKITLFSDMMVFSQYAGLQSRKKIRYRKLFCGLDLLSPILVLSLSRGEISQ